MRKTYQMILALALIMLGATNAMGQTVNRVKLDKSMFKAWDGCGADAKEVAPTPIDVTAENPSGVAFNCDYNLLTEVGDWSCIYGSPAVYYLWYADITGTQKIHFTGSAGFRFWVQFNRQVPVEGGDAHGGDMVQEELIIGDDGTCTYEIPSDMTYVHLNSIKTKGSGIRGSLNSIELEGTMKPATGIFSINKSMFKAWDGCGADAKEVAPTPIDVTAENPSGVAFNCDYNLITEVGDWSCIYGSPAVYYLWYADITGTQKIHFTGSAGFRFWVQFNRQAPVEGGDAHGGDMVQQELIINDDGTCTYEIPSDMTYVHLNSIKTKGSGIRGSLNSIELEGVVKPTPVAKSGDLNDDGDVDVTDVVELIDMVLAGSTDLSGDINGDGEVDVTDVVELIDIVLAGG
ncbi:MAG: hypothetical protein K6G32_10230 [Prevotella sp.]|nr:hypothetical protein [Prevotella sp.]